MIYVKSLLFGVGGAVLAAVLWSLARLVLPVWLPYVTRDLSETGGAGAGVGFSTGYVDSVSILSAAALGFIIAFAWEWFRLRSA